MSKKQIALVILLAVLAALVIALVVVDSKFAVIMGSPRVPSGTLVKPECRAQIVLNVPLAKDLIKKQFLRGIGVPDWVLPYVLPYEVAVLVSPDYVLSEMNIAVMVNDRRLGPIIFEKVNGIQIPKPYDQWFPQKMKMKQRGLLVKEGTARMDRQLLTKIKGLWKGPYPTEALRPEGNHMVEAVLDNRDGALVAMAATLAESQGQDLSEKLTPGVIGVLATIADIRLQGDLTPDDVLKLHLVVECTPQTDPAMVKNIQLGIELGFLQAQNRLIMIGIAAQGRSAVEGNTIKGDYTLPKFTNFLGIFNAVLRF